MTFLSKTVLLATATLFLAIAALVTDIVSPYAGDAVTTKPAQVLDAPAPSLRVPVKAGPSEFAQISSSTPRS